MFMTLGESYWVTTHVVATSISTADIWSDSQLTQRTLSFKFTFWTLNILNPNKDTIQLKVVYSIPRFPFRARNLPHVWASNTVTHGIRSLSPCNLCGMQSGKWIGGKPGDQEETGRVTGDVARKWQSDHYLETGTNEELDVEASIVCERAEQSCSQGGRSSW